MRPDRAAWLRSAFLVARREFVTRTRNRFFVISTIALVVMVVGFIVLQANVFAKGFGSQNVALGGSAESLAAPLTAATKSLGLTIKTRDVDTTAEGESLVRDGSVDAFIHGDVSAPTVAVKDALNPEVQAALTAITRQLAFDRALAARGVSPTDVAAEVAGSAPKVKTLDPGASQRDTRTVAGTVVAILLYILLLIYGQVLAGGVVEEKSNRIVEILLAAIRPRILLLGKVLGIGLVGMLQLAVVGVAALLAASRTQVINVPTVGLEAVLGGLLWFVLGYLFFGLIYAAGGSLVSRQEDLGSVTGPFSMVLAGTYFAFYWVLANPANHLAIAMSMIPPFAPILMPARMATGDAAAWQVVVAVVVTVGAIAFLNSLAARIYSNSVMRTGVRVSLREAWGARR